MRTALEKPLAVTGAAPRAPVWTRLLRAYLRLANREMLACAVVMTLTLGVRAALLPWIPVPQPAIHDEFSYLLAADTYAHGRLTNAPHPFWQHFETFQELQQPTYMSKYQPLQGLVLAFGQNVFGAPWAGIYLSTGLLCAAICWMLQGWIAPPLALLGASICLLRVGVLSYWMNSYMAGSVPAIGGALALGALVRIWRRNQFRHSITWAVGISLLALSRPYDATVLGIATAAILLWFLRRSRVAWTTLCRRVMLRAAAVLLLCATGIAYNDYRVTGHASTLPYQAHDAQYAVASMFTSMPLRPEPAYRHPVIRKFWADWNVGQRTVARIDPLSMMLVKFYTSTDFFFAFWVLTIPLLLWPYAPASAEERATAFFLLVVSVMVAPLIAIQPHYVGAFAGVVYLRALHGLTRLWRWRAGGKPIGRALVIGMVAVLVTDGAGLASGRDIISRGFALRGSQFATARAAMIRTLEKQPGLHLILVRYAPEHDPQNEWVFNAADIDASRIVWAHEMSPEEDRRLMAYFRGRRIWLLEPDLSPPKVTPYEQTPEAKP